MEFTKENRKWLDDLQLSHPLTIAGPCSAETETQMLDIAHQLKNSKISYFRAGVWKPRTRPGCFEGVGEMGLKWLQQVRKETGMKVATEVANKDHVRLALQYDIDMLWIGARSTVSPFIIQEMADELKGTDKPVLVKNPVNPDLSLWIGALERFKMAGVNNLGVIHRGFSTYQKTKYRNIPEWQIVIDLQNKFPDLPIICDPSHITGDREMIYDVSQTALDLNLDGLMIETHNNPEKAWSDASQQVTPKRLFEIVHDLQVRKETTSEEDYLNTLQALRSHIDIIDAELLDILEKRMQIANKIGTLKKEKNVAVLQNKRWNDILQKMVQQGKDKGLSEEFVVKIFKAIHQESINKQEMIFKG
ncbi:MAG: bifunctional 3-deoxy-7-phosphoheptulonate synthase/chorismate mutase type II [Flavobacteriaceae bacterium]|nr:bifunctional 3-deoxy-7-phosphoheptulonate synthase/chorismate mutase type II [Flavobacteriaceae bacterium]